MKNYCLYYQANVEKKQCWLFVATLRGFEHMVFDRTISREESLLEFFVPELYKDLFLQVMALFEKENIVTNFRQLPNRYITHKDS